MLRLIMASLSSSSVLFCAGNALAHHSFATHYDSNNIVEISGVLSAVDIRSPHSFLGVEIQREDGSSEVWEVEAHATALMRRLGIDEETLRVGDSVTVRGPRSRRPEKNLLFGAELETANGEQFEILQSVRRSPDFRVTDVRTKVSGPDRFAGRWVTFIPGQEIKDSPLPLNESGLAARAEFDPLNTPAMDCVPPNLPAMLFLPYIYEITVSGNEVVLYQEYQGVERSVTLWATATSSTPPGFGTRRGWMEGDTLVMETTGFPALRAGLASNWEPNGNGADVPSSVEKRLVERYTVSDGGRQLLLEYTLEDPVYMYEPYVHQIVWDRVPDDTPIYDTTCEADVATRSTLNAAPRD